MPALLDQYNLAISADFQSRVRMASIQVALNVQEEERRKGFDSFYNKRSALANTVLGTTPNAMIGGVGMMMDSEMIVQKFSYAVATQDGIDAPSPDSDIQNAVVRMWDPLAGVTEDEKPEVTP